MEPGALAKITVVFVEDRNGCALVRLPNGSKTSLGYDALTTVGGHVHFVRGGSPEEPAETANCLDCGWETTAPSRVEAEERLIEHLASAHTNSA